VRGIDEVLIDEPWKDEFDFWEQLSLIEKERERKGN